MRPRASSSISPDASFQRLNGRHGVAGVPRLRRARSRGRWTRCGRLRRCARCARVLRGGSRLGRWRRDSPGLRSQRTRFRSLETPRASDGRSRRIADQGTGNGADRSEYQRARYRPQGRVAGPLLGEPARRGQCNHCRQRGCQYSSHHGAPLRSRKENPSSRQQRGRKSAQGDKTPRAALPGVLLASCSAPGRVLINAQTGRPLSRSNRKTFATSRVAGLTRSRSCIRSRRRKRTLGGCGLQVRQSRSRSYP